MRLAPRALRVLYARGTPDLLQCSRRQDHRNGSAMLDDFDAAQRRDVVKKSAKVVFCMACRYLLHILAILAKTSPSASPLSKALSFTRTRRRGVSVGARSHWLMVLPPILAASFLSLAPAGAAGPNTPPVAAGSSSSEPQPLASDTWLNSRAVQAELSSGSVVAHTVVDDKSSRGTVEAAIRIRASAREIWPFITECRYAAWLIPGLKRCQILATAPDGSWADIEHVAQYSLFAPTMHSVFRAEFHPPYRMDFHRIGGNLKYEVGLSLIHI